MKSRLVIMMLMLLVAGWFFSASTAPYPYRLYETIPIIGFLGVMWGVFRLLPKRGRIVGLWAAAAGLPYMWATSCIALLYYFYDAGGRPYQSWDVSLTYLWIVYLALFYLYAAAMAIMETYQWKRYA